MPPHTKRKKALFCDAVSRQDQIIYRPPITSRYCSFSRTGTRASLSALACCLLPCLRTNESFQPIVQRNSFNRRGSMPSLFHPNPHSSMLSFPTQDVGLKLLRQRR